MIATDEAALRCDFLETYHILDYRALPARQAALFACGLPERSRIMRSLSGYPVDLQEMLLAVIADAVKLLVWQNTEDGHKGVRQPRSIRDLLCKKDGPGAGFATAAEFEAWRAGMFEGDD